jgi:hypothetical protein
LKISQEESTLIFECQCGVFDEVLFIQLHIWLKDSSSPQH